MTAKHFLWNYLFPCKKTNIEWVFREICSSDKGIYIITLVITKKKTLYLEKNCKNAADKLLQRSSANHCLQILYFPDIETAVLPISGSKRVPFPFKEVIIIKMYYDYAMQSVWTNQKRRPPEVSRRRVDRASLSFCDRFRVMLVEFIRTRFFLFFSIIGCTPWYTMSSNRRESTNIRPVRRFSRFFTLLEGQCHIYSWGFVGWTNIFNFDVLILRTFTERSFRLVNSFIPQFTSSLMMPC